MYLLTSDFQSSNNYCNFPKLNTTKLTNYQTFVEALEVVTQDRNIKQHTLTPVILQSAIKHTKTMQMTPILNVNVKVVEA